MDHATAVATAARERYFLGELDDSERDAFEEHYFGCAVCAAQVRSAHTFLTAARPLLGGDAVRPAAAPSPRPLAPRSWSDGRAVRLAASLAVLGLLGTVSYQRFVVIPRLERELLERELRGVEAGRMMPSFFLRSARGEPAIVAIPEGARFVVLRLSDSLDPSFAAHRFTLVDGTGRARRSGVLRSAPARTEELEVPLPTADLSAGSYVLVLEGISEPAASGAVPSDATARYPFRIERRD